jgi:hypothetical protein
MNSKALMVASSIVMGFSGLATSFAPVEFLTWLNLPTAAPLPIFIQIIGAQYFGFAITNWIARDNMIGSIYSRPLSIGNLVHFMVGALVLIKYAMANGFQTPLSVAMFVYTIFAACFAYLLFQRVAVAKGR